MHQELAWIEAIAPDFLDHIKERYRVLQYINWMGPVGRRSLADTLKLSERVLRTETEFLRSQNLINTSKSGMQLTPKGIETLTGLEKLMDQIFGVDQQELLLSRKLGIDHVIIVAGDSDQQAKVLADMGKIVDDTLRLLLPTGENVIAVMGGTTMAEVATQLTARLAEKRQLLFVPARGGIGEGIDIQANSVCAAMAKQTGGENRVLYIPEHVSEKTYAPLLAEPSVQQVLQLIDKSQTVLHSIGEAISMAERRDMPAKTIKMLKNKHAVGEAFGYFFDESGKVVYKIPRIGLQIRDLNQVPSVLAIAGGASKAKAIKAYMKNAPRQTWLITDAGAANSILQGETL